MKLDVWNQTDFTNGKEWSITESGIIMPVKPIHPKNASLPISVTK